MSRETVCVALFRAIRRFVLVSIVLLVLLSWTVVTLVRVGGRALLRVKLSVLRRRWIRLFTRRKTMIMVQRDMNESVISLTGLGRMALRKHLTPVEEATTMMHSRVVVKHDGLTCVNIFS